MLFFSFFVLHLAFSQTWVWGRQGFCYPLGEGYSVAEDAKANVFFTGGFYDSIQFGSHTLHGSMNYAGVFLVKYDPQGNALWARQSNYITGECIPYSVASDIHGNAYVCGFFGQSVAFGPDTLNNPQNIFFSQGIFLVKYDANGNLKWAKQSYQHIASNNTGEGYGVATDALGNAYITGYFEDTVSFGHYTLISSNTYNSFLVKYDTNGNVVWAKEPKYSTTGSYAYSLAIQDTNIYLTGNYYGTFYLGGRDTLISPAPGDLNIFLAKYNTAGRVNWTKGFIDKGSSERTCVTTDASGNVILGGSFEDTLLMGAYRFTDPLGTINVFLAKCNSSGNVLWALAPEVIVPNRNWKGNSVAVDAGRHIYYYGGASNGAASNQMLVFGNDTISYANAGDPGFIAEFDSLGNFLCGNMLPSGGDDYGAMTCDASGNNGYLGQDFFSQYSYRFQNDSLIPGFGGEYPILVKWENCANNPFLLTGRGDTVCHSCNGTLTASPFAGHAPYTYSWSNGQTTQTATGLCGGTYMVTVKDYLGKQDTLHLTVTSVSSLTVSVVPASDSICKGDSVQLTGSGGGTYKWSTGSTSRSIWVKPNVSANYTLHAFLGSCTDSAISKVLLRPDATPKLNIKDSVVCPHDSSYLTITTANGPVTYLWSNGATTSSIRVSDTVTTTYTATVYKTCDSVKLTKTVTVNPKTTLSIGALPDTICQYNNATLTATGTGVQILYKWSNGATSSMITVSPLSTTTYTATVYGECDSVHKAITVNVIPLPKTVITGKDSICSGLNDTLKVSGASTYLWSNGSTSSTYILKKVTGDSTLSVQLSNKDCIVDTTIKIAVIEPPVLSVNDKQICINNCTTLQATATGTNIYYSWSNGATTDTTTVCPTKDTSYTITVHNSCKNINSKTTIVVYSPTLFTCCDTVIDRGDTATLTATGDTTYKWSPSVGLNCSTCKTVTVSPTITTTYTVTGTDIHGCTIETTITILVDEYCFDFALPNVFTPNGDGINDYFKILPLPPGEVLYLDTYTITIYDRWGKEMFTSTNPNNYWNGNTESGNKVPDGVYYYIINATCQNTTYKKDGFVQLIR